MMITRLLIANRGEIACRIMRTARRMGISCVLAASEADARSKAAAMADTVEVIGPAPAPDSYLRADTVIAAARRSNCDAIHPGYGFLSESAAFAEAVAAAGLVFVGPTAKAMRSLGAKSAAKSLAQACGIPIVPGYHGEAQDLPTLAAEARRIGFPLLVKAVDGGGGRGMRAVASESELEGAVESARREAMAAFGSDRLLIERLIERPRHVEVQIFGDSHGSVVHLFERDCTLQRRNQKVIEEAPAPGLSAALRKKLHEASVTLARAAGYTNAGTVEFLIEGGRMDARAPHFFIEMNTRLQVEHPVTEAITGLDLVEWQLRIASGDPLPARQDDIKMDGHAVEVRLTAEDAARGFLPSTGRLAQCAFEPADDIRVECGYRTGDEVGPYYDNLIAKLIAKSADRAAALERLAAAIQGGCHVAGVRTNARLLTSLLTHATVIEGRMDTGLIGRELEALTASRIGPQDVEAAAAAFLGHAALSHGAAMAPSPWSATDGFGIGGARTEELPLAVDGHIRSFSATWKGGVGARPDVRLVERDAGCPASCPGLRMYHVARKSYALLGADQIEIGWPEYSLSGAHGAEAAGLVRSPINGRLVKVHVRAGQSVDRGARLAVVEAMKMEHVLVASSAGHVVNVVHAEGSQVSEGAVIVEIAEGAA